MSIKLEEVHNALKSLKSANILSEVPIPEDLKAAMKALVNAVDSVDDLGKLGDLPDAVREAYSQLPDELFEEEENEKESSSEGSSEDASINDSEDDLFGEDLFGDDNEQTDAEGDSEEEGENTEEEPQTPTVEEIPCTLCGEVMPEEDLTNGVCSNCAKKKAPVKKKTAPKKKAPVKKKTAPKKKAPEQISDPSEELTEQDAGQEETIINGALFFDFLNRVFLGKTITECVLEIQNGIATILAFDITSSLFVKSHMDCDGNFGKVGLGNLEVLLKYFKTRKKKDIALVSNENRLEFNSSGNEVFSYLASEVDSIATYTEELQTLSDITSVVSSYDYTCEIGAEEAKVVQDYIKMLKNEFCIISVEKNGTVCISGGSDSDHRFSANIDVVSIGDEDLPSIKVMTKHLDKVFSAVDFTDTCFMHISNGETFTLTNGMNAWGLSEIEDK